MRSRQGPPVVLTAKQRAVLNVIVEALAVSGAPPTYEEIRDRLKLKSVGAVQDHIRALEKKGAVVRRKGKARGLFPAGREPSDAIPILGRAPAGRPLEAIELSEGWLPIPHGKWPSESLFALRVTGDSMRDAAILPGDLVIVEKTNRARSGEIVVVLIDGEATIKRLELRGAERVLRPANPAHRSIPLPEDNWEIQGRVVGLWRETVERLNG